MDATQEQESESPRGGESSSGLGRLNEEQRSYLRFGAMIVTATVVMFLFMYLNTYRWDHIRWSETRAYMALLMGGTMAVIMLAFMLGMYKNWKINLSILGAALVLFGGSLWLVRSQATVDDSSYMNAMIPHHSIAILTSENDDIRDVRVRELADEILVAQRREIDEMKWLIGDIEENGVAETQQEAEARPVPDFQAEP
jgi:hypothetical protein